MEKENELVVIPTGKLIAIIEELMERFLGKEKNPYYSLDSRKELYSRKEAAEILKRSPNTITKYIRSKQLRATCLNNQYWITEKSLHDFINNKKDAKN